MSFKKIDKEYLVTDDSVNVYGFRLLTSGYLRDRFEPNPIGYYMHNRDSGVVVKWSDWRQENDKLYARPTINLANPKGEQVASEVENGFLNAASMGSIVVVEYSEDPELMLEGQTGPTITKWYNKELSLVDVPGNPNALASMQLWSESGDEINLADFILTTLRKQPLDLWQGFNLSNKFESMKQRLIAIMAMASFLPNLSAQSSDDDVLGAVQDLVDKAKKADALEVANSTLKVDKDKAVQDLSDFKASSNKEAIQKIIDAGITAKKITQAVAVDLSAKFSDDPESLKKVIDGLPAYVPITQKIGADGVAKELADLSWVELDRSGRLPDLKAADPEAFKAKFKTQFGVDYKD